MSRFGLSINNEENIKEPKTNKKFLISLPSEIKEMAAVRIRFFGNFSAYVAHLILKDVETQIPQITKGDDIQTTGSTKKSKITTQSQQ